MLAKEACYALGVYVCSMGSFILGWVRARTNCVWMLRTVQEQSVLSEEGRETLMLITATMRFFCVYSMHRLFCKKKDMF